MQERFADGLTTRSVCWLRAGAPPYTNRVKPLLFFFAALIGAFEGHSDIGALQHPGSVDYDEATKTYEVTGSGEDMWFAHDDFQFVWKKVSEDISLTADIGIPGEDGDPHRKAVLMMRQSLDADSAYADAALHGDGLASLQFRDAKGEITHEVQSNTSAPQRLRIEKYGDEFYMFTGSAGGKLYFSGGSAHVPMKPPFYVGLGLCAHNREAIQKARFTDVSIKPSESTQRTLYSTVETLTVASTDARGLFVQEGQIDSATWSSDGTAVGFPQPWDCCAGTLAAENPASVQR